MMFEKPLVSVDWLYQNIENKKLIVLDASLQKVTAKKQDTKSEDSQIVGAIFFDIKNVFSDSEAEYPNTALSPDKFEREAQLLGINNDSFIVVYDDLGVYSSPRAWWLFKLMGFNNVAILDGGFPKWKSLNYPIENKQQNKKSKGNFTVEYQQNYIKSNQEVKETIYNSTYQVLDARSRGRFLGTAPEPRKGIRGGRIPNSVSLPYGEVLEEGLLKSKIDLERIFSNISTKEKQLIFSCGTGITACVLALAAELSGYKNYAVYDGSWTEWASELKNPIEK